MSEHVDAAADLSAQSFLNLNKIWKSIEGEQDRVKSFFSDKINHALHAEREVKDAGIIPENSIINFALLKNGAVIGIVI